MVVYLLKQFREYVIVKALSCKQNYILRRARYVNVSKIEILFLAIAEIKLWYFAHVDLIGPYSKSIRQHYPGEAIIKTNVSLTCTTMINSATSWFEIIDMPMYNIDEVTDDNDEYIDK